MQLPNYGVMFVSQVSEILYIGGVYAFWLGVSAYGRSKIIPPAWRIVPGMFVVWHLVAVGFDFSVLLRETPLYITGAVLLFLAGLHLWSYGWRRENLGFIALAVLLWLQGLGTASYPFSYSTWFAPSGSAISTLLLPAIGVGLILVMLVEEQHGFQRKMSGCKQAKTPLAAPEPEFRSLAENCPDNIIRFDQQCRAIYCNPMMLKTLAVDSEKVLGKTPAELGASYAEVYTLYEEPVRRALESGHSSELEIVIPNADGGFCSHLIRIVAERDTEGNIVGVLAIGRDITTHKRAEQERKANLKFFENMDRVNRAIQGTDDLELMMKDLLDAVLSIFDCDRAFLMYPCDPESPTWTSPMERNKPEYPGVLDLKQEMEMDPQVAETLRILLAADGPIAFGPGTPYELPEEVSKQFGLKCFLSMAIFPKIGSPWQFGVHQCEYVRTWTVEEMRLFEAIGRRLEDSLSSFLSYRDLRENEELLDKIVDYIPNVIFVKDAKNLRIVRLNKACERLLGYSRDELIGKTDYDYFPNEDAEFFSCKDREVLKTKMMLDIPEEVIHNRLHEERLLHTKKIPIMDEAGTPQFLLGICEDITERKQAEESINKLSQAIEQSPVAIVITDIVGKIEFVNSKFSQVTGYSYEEALGQYPSILKSGNTTPEQYQQLWKTISSGNVWQGEFQNRKKNGELFWEQATIAPVRNAYKVITHYVAVKEDITERKKLEEQLRQAQKMEAVGQLAGGVAHDFNNMLGVINGYAELALAKEDLDDSLSKSFQGILTAGLRSSEITRQLLAFARKQTISPQILDLNETVEEMIKLLRRLIGEDIDLVWLPEPKLWPIKMDPSQIDQIMANLCVNARDAIGGVGRITIETQTAVFDSAYCAEHRGFSPGEYVMLAVSDNGSGMDKQTMGKIFEPFFTTKEIGLGTGLGLATIYGIVKQNAGFVNVYSELGQGSTFKIYLPHHTDLPCQELKTRPDPEEMRGHETILVVEDEVELLVMVKLMLETYGYQVIAASSSGEALLAVQKNPSQIQLLLADLIMPEMSGQDLSKQIMTLNPGIMCLFMSGYTNNAIIHQGILDEEIHFIQKPFSKMALAAKVREVLDAIAQ